MSDVTRITPLAVIRGKPVVTSLQIAEAFDKRHDHVLRDIEEILTQLPDSVGKPNFGVSEYVAKNNLGFAVPKPMYLLARDGFMLVAMGYTGRKAMAIKVAYIEEFNRLETLAHDLTRLQSQLAACHTELLKVHPLWRKVTRYRRMGLNHTEVGLLVDRSRTCASRQARRIEACGILTPPESAQLSLLEG